ncbi:hypothetical protein ACNGDX_09440 [Campylobacter coli]|uniref:hypothetical protein n=1 Tax=Campylobacter coli TaxID=195 RepID=UPI00069A7C10|nr:hypothetical protein [Campylobacter coli]EAH7052211.1 hypothetical protein [Campylobacter coli]EAJ5737222.1 hypothetical protein [Campylobacter coli]EAL3871522.1 hypothetical protein [Campylobacter coli]ECO2280348.1 hypothetical protein [Campylobacter coli]EEY3096703.1 hypothetical protein [Campylobacter coli]
MKKEKLEEEFWEFVAIITLFFVCTVIFAFTKLVPLAAVCWIMFLFFASVYPAKWIIQFILFLLKRKKGE